jgi:hypothetical protein
MNVTKTHFLEMFGLIADMVIQLIGNLLFFECLNCHRRLKMWHLHVNKGRIIFPHDTTEPYPGKITYILFLEHITLN